MSTSTHNTPDHSAKEKKTKGLLLINVGTPNAPTTTAVRRYLKAFLNDPLVIEMPPILRHLLVNGIIVPFRARKSAQRYQQLWTKQGSPLLVHLQHLQQKVQQHIAPHVQVFAAMNYGQPELTTVIQAIENAQLDELTVLPLFPHYTKSTTLSAKSRVAALTADWRHTKVRYIDHFYTHNDFIQSITDQAQAFDIESYDHVLFSYHSLPLKQVKASCASNEESYCYDKACRHTTTLLAKALNITKPTFSTAFQSRFSRQWLAPFTNEVLIQLAQQGQCKILVFTPSFVADCLETTIEIGQEYRDLFLQHGGLTMDLVPCPNSSDRWTQGVINITQ